MRFGVGLCLYLALLRPGFAAASVAPTLSVGAEALPFLKEDLSWGSLNDGANIGVGLWLTPASPESVTHWIELTVQPGSATGNNSKHHYLHWHLLTQHIFEAGTLYHGGIFSLLALENDDPLVVMPLPLLGYGLGIQSSGSETRPHSYGLMARMHVLPVMPTLMAVFYVGLSVVF